MPLAKRVLIAALFATAGFIVGYAVSSLQGMGNAQVVGNTLRDEDSGYDYVKPLLACSVDATVPSPELEELTNTFSSLVNVAAARGEATTVSLFYRKLDTGAWTSINDDMQFYPASLMKLPILLVYLKRAASDPTLLGDLLTLSGDEFAGNYTQEIAPADWARVDRPYTIEELLRLMIIHSDNRASGMLMSFLDTDVLTELLDDLDAPLPNDSYQISVRHFSRFFRILYNATYLTAEQSEYALRMLTESAYTNALVAGVDKGVPVAHKFGESSATLPDGSAGKELNDCGIVYTDSPYLLCVMTQGPTFEGLEKTISSLSRAAFEFSTR